MSESFEVRFEDDIPLLVKKAKATMLLNAKGTKEYKQAEKFLKETREKSKVTKEKPKKRSAKEALSDSDAGDDDDDEASSDADSPSSDEGASKKTEKRKKKSKREDSDVDWDSEDEAEAVSQKKAIRVSSKNDDKKTKATVDEDQDVKVYFFRATGTAKTPKKATVGAAGYDVAAAYNYKLKPNESIAVDTGVKAIFPLGTYGRIAGRSSLALRKLIVTGGVIDNDFTGTIKVIIINLSGAPVKIYAGDRVGQIVVEKFFSGDAEEVATFTKDTERGISDFGSTGIKSETINM